MRLYSERATLKVPLNRTTVDELTNGVLTVGVPNSTMESLLRDNLPALEEAIRSATGAPLRVTFRIGGSDGARGGGSPIRRPAPPNVQPAAGSPSGVTPAASTESSGGELGLLDYARKTIGEMEPR